jgi:hypothetical protein
MIMNFIVTLLAYRPLCVSTTLTLRPPEHHAPGILSGPKTFAEDLREMPPGPRVLELEA